jgi:hypothetical protein
LLFGKPEQLAERPVGDDRLLFIDVLVAHELILAVGKRESRFREAMSGLRRFRSNNSLASLGEGRDGFALSGNHVCAVGPHS